MAPGCFDKQDKTDSSSYKTVTNNNSNESNLFDQKVKLASECVINLDEIPLPDSNTSDDKKEESKTKTNTNLSLNKKKLSFTFKPCDTVDSFEILEQTILKQKRLAKLKNTDLRKKILLKRTFDLVCEIMDHENGFEQEDEENEAANKVNKNISNSNSDSSSDEEEEEEEDDSDSDEESSDSDEEEQEKEKQDEQLIPKSELILVQLEDFKENKCEQVDFNSKNNNLDNLYSDLDLVEFGFEDYLDCELSTTLQAQVPINKRRNSNSDEEEDEDEDEEQVEDDYQLKEQQLDQANNNLKLNPIDLNFYDNSRTARLKRKTRTSNEDNTKLQSKKIKV